MNLLCTMLVLIALVQPSWAACDEDTIETISGDGDLIVLHSGQEYDVDSSDEATASTWSEGDDVLGVQ